MAATVHRHGLTELYRPPGSVSQTTDIFFVHGLFGHPRETWTKVVRQPSSPETSTSLEEPARKKNRWTLRPDEREVFWPQDLLPQALPNARIFTWGYDVQIQNIFNAVSKATVFQHAETLLLDITSVRTAAAEKRIPIIFMAHSLGGIVVKEALCLSKSENTFLKDILPATAGVCFLGTPHRGSRTASLGKVAFGVSRVLGLQDPNLNILRSLEVQSDILERIGKGFSQILGERKLKVHSFREELKTKGMMIVDTFSSSLDHFAETRGSIHANHREMTRFASQEDVGFRRVSGILASWQHEEAPSRDLMGTLGYSGLRTKLASIRDTQLVNACLSSLDNVDARQRIQIIEKHFEDTYHWLFENRVGFENWLRGETENPIFWISGKPGSGKSTIMKMALEHSQTRTYLHQYDPTVWTVAGFFFHDRGSGIQKSIDGLLKEILFQVLRNNAHLIRPLLETPFFEAHSSSLFFHESEDGPSFHISWNAQLLESALLSLISEHPLCLCLFIDALDEHDGNHQHLVSFIQRLSSSPGERSRLRICLASRPENIFEQRLKDAPGFPIHQFTQDDISLFARSELSEVASETGDTFEPLLENLLEKARGVFLWVKLVTSELLDHWLSGDTIEELQSTLSEIPDELQALYWRALQRGRARHTRSTTRDRLEAYIMFKIAEFNPPKLYLDKFTKLVQYNIMGDQFKEGQFTPSQMKRRLNDRSSGLLEVLEDNRERTTVQFIHQSAREYFLCDAGYQALYPNSTERPIATGLIYFIRATLWLRALDGSFYAPDISVIESKHRLPATSQLSAEHIRQFIASNDIMWPIPTSLVKYVQQTRDEGLAKAFVAIVFSFDVSLEEALTKERASSLLLQEYGTLLLRVTTAMLIARSRVKSPSEVLGTLRCLRSVVLAGVQPTDAFEGRTCVSDLQEADIDEDDLVKAMEVLST